MRQVKITAASKVVQRIAVIACVGILGVGAAACGDNTKVTPQAPTPTQAPAAGQTPATTTPPTTASAQSGGSGF